MQAWLNMWLEFAVDFILAPMIFLKVLWIFSLLQNQHSKFQLYLETVDKKSHLGECSLLIKSAIIVKVIIYFSLHSINLFKNWN